MINNVSVGYTATNIALALILLWKSPKNVIGRFYFFCVAFLDCVGILSASLNMFPDPRMRDVAHTIIVFCFSLLPFFFLHFIAYFVRRADLVRSKRNLGALYFAGLFSYAMILLGFTPEPITALHEITRSGYLFYITWHSIFFCIGIAMLYEYTQGFYGKVEKANLLFSSFAVLLLILPGPFTETVFFGIFHLNVDWYFISCSFAIILGVYFIFRHKIVVNTIYDALKSALSVMNDIFILTDEMFMIQMARGALTPMLHYTEKELLGKSFIDLIDQKELLTAYREFALQGKMKESYFDADMILKNGERLPMNFSFTPVYTNQEITGFVSIARSLSELRHSEQALRLFNHAVESTPECIAITELNDSITYANKAFLDKYGYSADEILGKQVSIIQSPDNPASLLREIKESTLNNKWSGELLHVTKHNQTFPVRLIRSPIYDDGGKIIGQVSAIEDITDQKLAKLALQTSEARFRALFENVPVGVFQISTNGRFIAANPNLARMLGHESVTEDFLENIGAELHADPRAREAWDELLEHGTHIRNLEIAIVKDEKEIYFLQNIHPYRNTYGEIEYFEGTLTDITERKKLEDELLHAQRMESIGTLAGGIAHDFNNILQIILINSSKLNREMNSPEAHARSVDSINKSVHRGAGLVRQLMTFARKAEVVFSALEVNSAVEELQRMLVQTFPANIEIDVKLTEVPAIILANQTQFHQVLLNLCVNARDAMPNGGKLSVTTESVPGQSMKAIFGDIKNQDYILIVVTDTGTGMEESVRRRIFEPFYTTKDRGRGTGLGLAVVYGIIKNHEGYITVESEVGKGSTFRVLLPVHKQRGLLVQQSDGEFEDIPGGDETILLVEDETDVRNALKNILSTKGYTVIPAIDGEEAIDIYRNQQATINVVLLDMGLPKVNGYHVFLTMKQINPSVNALICSGYLDPARKSEIMEAGIRDFIQKPYITEDVLRRIRLSVDQI